VRDRDVRNAIHDALVATGAFDGVVLWGLPEEYGSAASQLALAAIEPDSSEQRDEWDSQPAGGLTVHSRVKITLLLRADDPVLRDEAAELLVDTVANALNGQSLAGLTLPAWTRVTGWQWQPAVPPERRITVSCNYAYIVEGWNAYDTTE